MAHQSSDGATEGGSGRIYSLFPWVLLLQALGVPGHPFFPVREKGKGFHSGYSRDLMLTSGRHICI